MRQDCPECQRLWREYAAATTSHVGLESKLRLGDSTSMEALTHQVASAATVRENTRQAIQQHETDAHAGVADPAEIDG